MSLSKLFQPPKPWAVSDFHLYRPNITHFADTQIVPLIDHSDNRIRRICIHGEVKSGKREIVEYLARRDYGNDHRKHIFISALHRVADDPQRVELKDHHIEVYSVNYESVDKIMIYINENIERRIKMIIHYDECDYGSGYKQRLSEIYKTFKNQMLITSILYSATPEELLYSNDISNNDESFISEFYELGVIVKFIPPETYCGAKKFLDENLVFDAKPFIIKNDEGWELSNQAKEIILDAKNNLELHDRKLNELKVKLYQAKDDNNLDDILKYKDMVDRFKFNIRNIIVLRLTYSDFRGDKIRGNKISKIFLNIFNTFSESDDINIINDEDSNRIKWSDEEYWNRVDKDKLNIFVHDQTSTRSTEWVFHNRLFATHDYRPVITYNTTTQAQLRVAHYSTKYGGFQPIKVYGHKKSFEYAAKYIKLENYFKCEIQKIKFSYNNIKIGQLLKFKVNFEKKVGIVTDFNLRDKKCVVLFEENYSIVHKSQIINNKETYIICDSNENINTEFNDTYSEINVKNIMRNLGAVDVKNMSARVSGKSKNVLKIFSKFIECDKNNINERIRQEIKNCENLEDGTIIPRKVRDHKFKINEYFNHPQLINEEIIYNGILRSEKRKYTYDELKVSRWGFNDNNRNPRLTVCYNTQNNLGVCLRFVTGETESVDNFTVYKSMYQS
jgi:hypothetical protein